MPAGVRQFFKGALRDELGTKLIEKVVRLASKFVPNMASPRRIGAYSMHVSERIANLIDAIPSETSQKERRFLYRYFADQWAGNGNVVEVGPFLGGTTRAIALGMLNNPRRLPRSKLVTFDRFHSYYSPDAMTAFVQPLIDGGQLSVEDLQHSGESVDFLTIFTAIHAAEPYWELVETSSLPLPDRRADLNRRQEFMTIQGEVGAAFIDGCKSWFATKYFMQQIAPHCRPGTPLLFQDYRCRTCFWISAFVEVFRDNLRLFAQVGDTHAFILTKPIGPKEIDARFPDEPMGFLEHQLVALFDRLIATERARQDHHGAFIHELHKAAALAYIGRKDEARALLANLETAKLWSYQRHLLKLAWIAPTYTPDGDVLL